MLHIDKNRNQWSAIFVIIALCISTAVTGQQGTIQDKGIQYTFTDDSVDATKTGSVVFTSFTGSNDRAVQLDVLGLFRNGADLTGGIKADMPATNKGRITLKVYSYDSTANDKKGALLYQKVLAGGNTGTVYGGSTVNIKSPVGSGVIKSDDIKALLQGAKTTVVDKSRCKGVSSGTNLLKTSLAYHNGMVPAGLDTNLYNCLKGNNYRLTQPVIIEVTIQQTVSGPLTVLYGIKVPGLVQEFFIPNYFAKTTRLSVDVAVNGTIQGTYNPDQTSPPVIQAKMGDSITFKVNYPGKGNPEIIGMPSVWVARFAGDLMYYTTPSVRPGDFTPFIGYDSRVHNLQMRKYPPGFQVKVPDWQKSGDIYTWSWTTQRRMDANKTGYDNQYIWLKYKMLNNGRLQRNNQREGLNIQFLSYWGNFLDSNYKQYDGAAKYMMGFDDDELLYLNTKYHNAVIHPPPPYPNGGIVKLDTLPSRYMPEGPDQLLDVQTGYPAQSNPLNMILTAYQRNRQQVINGKQPSARIYNGYEIQDLGTNEQHPNGAGIGNNTAPGLVQIRAGNLAVDIPVNVSAPLTVDKGFYSSLTGEQWPAYNEKNVAYTLSGLDGMSTTELDKYSMEYSYMNSLGSVIKTEVFLSNASAAEKKNISASGLWIVLLDTATAYGAVTAYYQRDAGSVKVMIAGKELIPEFLLFLGDKNLEGKGLGAKIWLEDFRSHSYGEYTQLRKFGNTNKYTKPYVREYTYPVGVTTVFTAWDGDPHTFYDPGTEWFLSSRKLAKRIPDSYLDGSYANGVPNASKAYLKYFINDAVQTSGRYGKDFAHAWKKTGDYELGVQYRFDSDLTSYTHKIKIVDYTDVPGLGKTLGNIVVRLPTSNEKKWLGLKGSGWKMAEVVNVQSSYKYKDGPRANSPYPNRWAKFNDYASEYGWKERENDQYVSISQPPEVINFVNHYDFTTWFWDNWALHYSSNWRDKNPDGLPNYVPNNAVTRVNDLELDIFSDYIKAHLFTPTPVANWQSVVPLVSYTDYQGNRLRTNPSCIYDIHAVWDNQTGAFSGKPKIPSDPAAIQAPDISDDDKDRQELYHDLKSNRKFLLTKATQTSYLAVYNVAPKGGETFIAVKNPSE